MNEDNLLDTLRDNCYSERVLLCMKVTRERLDTLVKDKKIKCIDDKCGTRVYYIPKVLEEEKVEEDEQPSNKKPERNNKRD